MSLVAPGHYWDQRSVYSYMYNDTIASVMDLSEEATSKKAEEEAKEKETLRKLQEKYPDA